LVGLTRALQVAGARSVVATQWQVPDASTAVLMQGFYRHLVRGLARDEALRRAMRESSAGATRPPFCWAGFVLNGAPDRAVLIR
jgi:CHAT domain-containing protein